MWAEDRNLYFLLEAVDLKTIQISYTMSDHFCEGSTCTDLDVHDIKVSWNAVDKTRRKKSLFFGLQSGSEVNDKVQSALEISKQ